MAKQFDDDQVAVLQRIIHEHEHGLDPGTNEWFAPPQKLLTYNELAVLRRMIVAHNTAEVGRQMVERAVKYALLPPRSKTSILLADAADMIDAVAREFGLTPGNSTLLGKDWKSFTTQLRDRASTFQKLDQ